MSIFNNIKQVPEANLLNAVIYARYSSTNQTENSIDGQLRECKKYAKQHGFKVINEYIDRASSGTNDNRPEFQKMIKDSDKQNFAFVIVYRFDRFARNRFDSAIYKKQLAENGVKVLSASENVGSGDEGIILESIYEAMDEAYSRRLSRITQRGMRETALKGLWTGGHTPFGFDIVDKKLAINDAHAQAIKYAAQEIEKGTDLKTICDKLFDRGIRGRNGKKITASTLRVIISNPAITGKRKYQDIEIPCPAIIDEEQFNKINAIVNKTQRKIGKPPQEDFFTLAGKLFCGVCGATMTGDSGTSRNGEKHYYYTCSTRKKRSGCTKASEKKDFIEWYICEQTIANVLTEDNIKKIAKMVVQMQKEDNVESTIKTIKKSLSSIEKEFDKLADALIRTPTDTIAKRIEKRCIELEEQKENLEDELTRLQMIDNIKLKESDVEKYLKEFKKGDLFDKEFRRKVIKTLVNSVYLYDDKIVIYFNLKNSKLVSYMEMLSDIESLEKSHPGVFEKPQSWGAIKKRHEPNSCLFFMPSCCGSKQRRPDSLRSL